MLMPKRMSISFLPVNRSTSLKDLFLSFQEIFTSKDLADKVSAHSTPTCTHIRCTHRQTVTATHDGGRRGNFRLPQPKDEEARSAVPAAEALIRARHGGHTCLQTSAEESRICTAMSFPSSLPPLGSPWNDLHLITCGASVGSCCCLLILSFTYNRHVLFTNRIQNSRCFIMSLLCVITNAAGRLPWLPLCRLLPGLRRAALPCRRRHPHVAQQKQKPP